MMGKENNKINLDLVFETSDFPLISKNLSDINDKLIFESSFWEKVFLCWIRVVIEEKNASFPRFIFAKNFFSLSLQIISNQEIAAINQKWMQKIGPTDVLSFPIISHDDAAKNLPFLELGDLFISLEMAVKQSAEYNHSMNREMLWLASHGFLHLLGWEHNDDYELDNMLNFQEYLISRLD